MAVRRTKPGPKPMAQEKLRARILGVKLNKAEYAALAAAAGPYPVATWARVVLMEAAKAKKEGRR